VCFALRIHREKYYLSVSPLWHLHVINESATTRKISGRVRYLFSRKLAAISEVGYDDNQFASRSDSSGIFWNIGAEWKPSSRTSLEATYGNRFFGNDFHLSISHRGRRFRTQLNYIRKPSSTRVTLLEQQVFNITDPFGDSLVDPLTQNITALNVSVPNQSTEILIRSKLKGLVSYRLRKHTLRLSARYEETDYQLSGDTEFSRDVDMSWVWKIFPRTNAQVSIRWDKDNRRSNRDDRYLSGQIRLTHTLGPATQASIGARYVDRDSNDNSRKYDETRIFANLTKTF